MTGTGLLLNNLNPLTVKNAYLLPSDWTDYHSHYRFVIIINIIVVVDTVLIFFFQKSRLRWRKKGENSLWLRSKRTIIIIGTMEAEVYILNFSYRFKDHIIVNTS